MPISLVYHRELHYSLPIFQATVRGGLPSDCTVLHQRGQPSGRFTGIGRLGRDDKRTPLQNRCSQRENSSAERTGIGRDLRISRREGGNCHKNDEKYRQIFFTTFQFFQVRGCTDSPHVNIICMTTSVHSTSVHPFRFCLSQIFFSSACMKIASSLKKKSYASCSDNILGSAATSMSNGSLWALDAQLAPHSGRRERRCRQYSMEEHRGIVSPPYRMLYSLQWSNTDCISRLVIKRSPLFSTD